jgi:hypothetical protein
MIGISRPHGNCGHRTFARKERKMPDFILEPKDIQGTLREWLDIFYPDGEADLWLTKKNEVFHGQSPIAMLSIRHDIDPDTLYKNVGIITEKCYDAMSFLSVETVPTTNDIYQEIVEAQKNALNNPK